MHVEERRTGDPSANAKSHVMHTHLVKIREGREPGLRDPDLPPLQEELRPPPPAPGGGADATGPLVVLPEGVGQLKVRVLQGLGLVQEPQPHATAAAGSAALVAVRAPGRRRRRTGLRGRGGELGEGRLRRRRRLCRRGRARPAAVAADAVVRPVGLFLIVEVRDAVRRARL